MRQYRTETKLRVNDLLMWNERTIDIAVIELFSTPYFRDQTQLISIVLAKHFCGVGIVSLLKTCSLVLEHVVRFRVERSMGDTMGGQSEAMDQLLHAFDRRFSDHKHLISQIICWAFNIVNINLILMIKFLLTFRHRASCILGQAFYYSPENAFYIFNQQIYFIIWYLLDRASLI